MEIAEKSANVNPVLEFLEETDNSFIKNNSKEKLRKDLNIYFNRRLRNSNKHFKNEKMLKLILSDIILEYMENNIRYGLEHSFMRIFKYRL